MNPREQLAIQNMSPHEVEEWRATQERRARISAGKAARRLDKLGDGLNGMHPTEHAALIHAERREVEHHQARADYWAQWTPKHHI